MTHQTEVWQSKFGDDYTDRNDLDHKGVDDLYLRDFGVTRTQLNNLFLGDLDKNIKILEVGSNVGMQLNVLLRMGFCNLQGIEINYHSIELANRNGILTSYGEASNIPFNDESFDLVFTSGLLMHIIYDDLEKVMREICKCTKKYIWCFEPYSDTHVSISYRDTNNFIWKGNFAKLFLEYCPELKLEKEIRLKYLQDDNLNTMFLLSKRG